MPNANRFCHQDTGGLDTDQLPLPRDRLPEHRWALSKIDGHCQKMISPRPDASPRRSSNPRQRCLLGRVGGRSGRQPGGRPAPGPAASQSRGAHNSQERRGAGSAHGGRPTAGRPAPRGCGTIGSPPHQVREGASACTPLTHFCTSKPSTEPGTQQAPSECQINEQINNNSRNSEGTRPASGEGIPQMDKEGGGHRTLAAQCLPIHTATQ